MVWRNALVRQVDNCTQFFVLIFWFHISQVSNITSCTAKILSVGYQGDPYYRCYRRNNDPCNPNPCGPHSNCVNRNNYASCSCAQGFIGTPPHCRAECEGDYHCNHNQVCRHYRCRNPCDGACNDIPNTQCRVINRRPVCARYQTRCPDGYYGRDCSSIYEKNDNPPPRGGSAPDEQEENIISPCVPFPCGGNAECITRRVTNSAHNETSEVALCQCPPGKTGNADKECYPVEEQQVKVTREELRHDLSSEEESGEQQGDEESEGPTVEPEVPPTNIPTIETTKAPKKCGTNAIAIMSAGKSICSCPIGFTGIASIECHELPMSKDAFADTAEYDYISTF